jgi:hypothetical protein
VAEAFHSSHFSSTFRFTSKQQVAANDIYESTADNLNSNKPESATLLSQDVGTNDDLLHQHLLSVPYPQPNSPN